MSRTSRKKKKKWPWIVGIPAVLLIGIFVFIFVVYKDFTNTVKNTYEPIDREISGKRDVPIVFDKQDPFSVLVLGVDAREGDAGRSDTIIVLTVNPETNSTKMVSIPRDTYTEIIGRGFKDKLNHAYAFGGITMAMDSVENLLDIPIDYVVQVDMDSFKDIVDAVGGINVNNTLDFKQGQHHFAKGNIHLNGDEALSYVRMRKEDPRGDFGRQDRQKQIVQGVLREGASVSSILNYKDIFSAIGNNIRTNITFDEMVDIQKNYRKATDNIEQIYIENGQGQTMNGVWYYMLNDEELNQIQGELKEHLEI